MYWIGWAWYSGHQRADILGLERLDILAAFISCNGLR